jgi:hypothetical protein
MNLSKRARALAVLAASASLVAVPLTAAPSGAAITPKGKCTKLTSKTVKGNITATLTGCTPTAATGGKGGGTFKSAAGAPTGTLTITIKWAAGKGTTKANIKFVTQKTLGKCAKGKDAARYKITGKVTGGTGTAAKTIKKNEPVTASVCSHPTKGLSLETGTVLKF